MCGLIDICMPLWNKKSLTNSWWVILQNSNKNHMHWLMLWFPIRIKLMISLITEKYFFSYDEF